jgi:hypothetical protein
MHYRVATSDCDLGDLSRILLLGHREKSKIKRQEKIARWDSWGKEEQMVEAGMDHLSQKNDVDKRSSDVREH